MTNPTRINHNGTWADLHNDDCLSVLRSLTADSVDLIVTSPPYATQRADTYGGVKPSEYVAWFLTVSEELLRVLKPEGTFVLNIKENVVSGERSTYVLELIQAMRGQGWLWTEEFIWAKKNSFPGKWPNRFRDSWERLLQFNKQKKFAMYQDAVMIPASESTKKRALSLSDSDKTRHNSDTSSGFARSMETCVGRKMVYPSNVLHLPTETSNKGHSAAFPASLPEWFIKLFTEEGDTVLDPFLGSGTTAEVALKLGRNAIGCELVPDYFAVAIERVGA